jgi:hypothetical protein
MTGLHFRKNCKHWSKSPVFVSFDQNVISDTPNTAFTRPQTIQTKAVITSKLKSNIKEGGRA